MPVPSFIIACTRKTWIARNICELAFTKPEGFRFKAGQFVLAWVPGVDELPLSVVDDDGSFLTLAFFAIGPGTQASLTANAGSSTVAVGGTTALSTTGGSGSGLVSFASNSANCTILGSTLTAAAVGSCIVTATKAADANYLVATATVQVTVAATVGGTVAGLAAGNSVVLRNNGANDLSVAANGAFTFTTALNDKSPYAVTVFTQPTTPNQTCLVTNGSGTIAGANISNVTVICTTSGGDPTITPVATSRATGSPMYRSVIANVSDAAGAGSVLVTVNGGASATANGVLLQAIQNNNGVISAAIRGGCFSPISPPVISFTLTASSSSGSNTANLPITITAGNNPTWCQWWPR